jgi:3-phenylpropionate/cinnamic acid dioxygenase small subunit
MGHYTKLTEDHRRVKRDLELVEDIRDRKAKYCRYLDTKQFDAWEQLFTNDVRITFYGTDRQVLLDVTSFDEFSRLTRQLFATTRTIHQVHNSEITLKSELEAEAIWSMEDWHIYTPTEENPAKTLHGYGHYYETWRLVDGLWKIARLELRRIILEIH